MLSPMREASSVGRSSTRELVGVVAVTSGMTLSRPPSSQTKSRFVSPGGVAKQSGRRKVSPGKAGTIWMAVAGGVAGTFSVLLAMRRTFAICTVTVCGAV